MRNTEERLAHIELRLKEIKKKKRLNQMRTMGALSVVLSLVIIVGISTAMPGIMAGMGDAPYGGGGAAAGIFVESSKIGYIFIGILAFVLGVCVTLLAFQLRQKEKADK